MTFTRTSCRSSARLIQAYMAGCVMFSLLALLISMGSLHTAQQHPPGLRSLFVPHDGHVDHSSNTQNNNNQNEYKFDTHSVAAPRCHSLDAADVDFTFVTQLSTDRLWLMKEHCRRWGPHPISIAVGGPLASSKATIVRTLREFGCDTTHLHVGVLAKTTTTTTTTHEGAYPINELRNLALSQIRTTHAVFVDADFLPSTGLYEHLMAHAAQKTLLASNAKAALVIPAFELRSLCEEDCHDLNLSVLPSTPSELVDMMAWPLTAASIPTSLVAPFDSRGNPGGHGSTDYAQWRADAMSTSSASASDDGPDSLPIKMECLQSSRYEPYLVLRYCQDLPPFQRAFTGYGNNKLSWSRHLRHVGYQLYQLGRGDFVIHFPHAKSESWKQWHAQREADAKSESVMDRVGRDFMAWLHETVPDTRVMPLCHGRDVNNVYSDEEPSENIE